MIVTKSWLNEYVNLEGISTEEIVKTLNSIGLEVESVQEYVIPQKIVFGHVLECEKHPDADKLSVCKVDVGTAVLQIVCGASNVRQGLFVAVATVGAVMPGGLEIKAVKLRGVESEGMICSSSEIGLPSMGEGIMELDESTGKITLGDALNNNVCFQDARIEIELTANRGDCLSIHGVARDLSAAFGRPLAKMPSIQKHENRVGIGRILQVVHTENGDTSLKYKVVDIKDLHVPFIVSLRLAQIEEASGSLLEDLIAYTTHMTGVILRSYDYGFFLTETKDKKAIITLKTDTHGYLGIYASKKASTIGISQESFSSMQLNEGMAIIEASYIPPENIAKKMAESKIEEHSSYYRSSRGSEPDLTLGTGAFLNLLEQNSDSKIYGGSIDVNGDFEEKVISISVEDISSLIGKKIDKTTITKIFQHLQFNIDKSKGDAFTVIVPRFRHDISNKQDLIEEVLRFVGIDNIPSKPYVLQEENCLSSGHLTFKRRRHYRHKAADVGFFEAVHFVFTEKKKLLEHGFVSVDPAKELLNPIANTFDTLRPTIMLGLLNAAGLNAKTGYKSIRLFEIGSVFSPNRKESAKMAFLYSGEQERERISNGGKAKKIDFGDFVQRVCDVIGDITLAEHTPKHALAHPYQCAQILTKEGTVIGELFKLHPSVQAAYDLDVTFLCEIDFDALVLPLHYAKPYSKYQASFRDLSLLIPTQMHYSQIQSVIEEYKSEEIVRFYPVDRYEDEKLGEYMSLTVRFMLRSLHKTLEEEDITASMEGVLGALNEKLGLSLR
jgi:phenylalanyl-tRNA synthetase beta chain